MSLDWTNYTAEPCYVCGRKLGNKTPHVAYLIDDNNGAVFVGVECIKAVQHAGDAGLATRKGAGPRVFSTVLQAAAAGVPATHQPILRR
jgi:hypothetical protein